MAHSVSECCNAAGARQVSVTLWSCDAFHLCQFRLPADVTFDVIDTSNLADHVSLLNLLVACQPRLRKCVLFRCLLSISARSTPWRNGGVGRVDEVPDAPECRGPRVPGKKIK